MNGVEKSRALLRDSRRVSSAEEVVSRPQRTVAEKRKGRSYNYKHKVHAHSQVLRIRAEDSNLGEDRFGVAPYLLFSRPLLPASPLSGKTPH